MTFANEGGVDRSVRAVAGAVLIALGWSGTIAGTMGTVAMVVGVVLIVTSLIGWCPAYTLFGFSTRR
ncbi:MAG: DUF2892 domain-containing protein [Vicinamibacterales bacterium]